ncbi:MAG: DUF4296 domain-containing protein [Chitinophagaceae bacterium]|nr:DUF4296 domain-containing protein [Chitinophagaceae bacterium]MCB9045686.1 DUF4296 domain-containing protein [Chitinophagales bacterium]
MRRILLSIIGCMLLTTACKDEELKHLSRDKMTTLLTDLHIAEVYSTMVNDSTHKSLNKNTDSLAYYYKSILAHHNVSMHELQESMQWYGQHPSELDSVYITMLNELSTMEGLQHAGE